MNMIEKYIKYENLRGHWPDLENENGYLDAVKRVIFRMVRRTTITTNIKKRISVEILFLAFHNSIRKKKKMKNCGLVDLRRTYTQSEFRWTHKGCKKIFH